MTPLETRPFGKTGERVTIIGLGGACLNQRSYEDGLATVRRALDLGITYFDTSPQYGDGVSQAILGEALEGRPEQYILATKLGHLPNPNDFRSPTALRAQIEDNLRLLRRNQVDVLQVHEACWLCWWADGVSKGHQVPSDLECDFANAPIMKVLREAKEKGLCRFVGITGNELEEMTHVLHHVDVDTFLLAFNYDLIMRGAPRKAFPVARDKGVAMILGGVFQYGRMAEVRPELVATPPEWMTPQLLERFRRLYELQSDCGLSMVELTIRYLLSDPMVATILVGAAIPSEVEKSVDAALKGPLPPELHKAVEDLGMP